MFASSLLRKGALLAAMPVLVTGALLAGTTAASAVTAGDPPPSNDNFATPLVMSAGGGQFEVPDAAATVEVGEPDPLPNHVAALSLWYRWTPTRSGPATITTKGSDYDTVLAGYTGSSLKALTLKASNDDASFDGVDTQQSKITLNVTAGVTYRIALDGYNAISSIGWSVLSWNMNDNFGAAETLNPKSAGVDGSNVDATSEPGEPLHAGQSGGRSVWYRWTPTVSGFATVEASAPSFNTLLAVYKGAAVNTLTPIASNDDFGVGIPDSRVGFPVAAGKTYRIAVDGKGGSEGWFALTASISSIKLNVAGGQTAEGSSGTHNLPFTLTLDHPSALAVTVNFATANGTATAGSDYVAKTGSVTFAPGQTSKTVNVLVKGDKVKEPNETVKLKITKVSGGGIGLGASTPGTIANDD